MKICCVVNSRCGNDPFITKTLFGKKSLVLIFFCLAIQRSRRSFDRLLAILFSFFVVWFYSMTTAAVCIATERASSFNQKMLKHFPLLDGRDTRRDSSTVFVHVQYQQSTVLRPTIFAAPRLGCSTSDAVSNGCHQRYV